jgi:peptide chain release factor 3
MDRVDKNRVGESIKIKGLKDPEIDKHIPTKLKRKLVEEVEIAKELLSPLNPKSLLEGHLTPIWFGSAMNSFGVQELMKGIANFGPSPQMQSAVPRSIKPLEKEVSGFVFKVQANMDPKHRDRVAFVRLASGHFK